MTLTDERFRQVMGHLAGGVTVVTSVGPGGEPRGLTATAVCSVSLEPPLVLACLDAGSATHDAIRASGRYALNFLAADSRDLSERFAVSGTDKFEGVEWEAGALGCPLLLRAMAACECRVVRSVPAGDHTIFIGAVEEAKVERDEGGPARALAHFRGGYSVVHPPDETEG